MTVCEQILAGRSDIRNSNITNGFNNQAIGQLLGIGIIPPSDIGILKASVEKLEPEDYVSSWIELLAQCPGCARYADWRKKKLRKTFSSCGNRHRNSAAISPMRQNRCGLIPVRTEMTAVYPPENFSRRRMCDSCGSEVAML